MGGLDFWGGGEQTGGERGREGEGEGGLGGGAFGGGRRWGGKGGGSFFSHFGGRAEGVGGGEGGTVMVENNMLILLAHNWSDVC